MRRRVGPHWNPRGDDSELRVEDEEWDGRDGEDEWDWIRAEGKPFMIY